MNFSSSYHSDFPSDLDFLKWDQPGIGCFECLESKKCFLFSSSNVLHKVLKLQKSLENSSLKNKEILIDFKKYGPDSFRFILLHYGDQFADPYFRKKKLKEIKRSWEGSLY